SSAKGRPSPPMSSTTGTPPPPGRPWLPASPTAGPGGAVLHPRGCTRPSPICTGRAGRSWPPGLSGPPQRIERNTNMQTFDSIAALCRAASVPADQAAREAAHRRWASLAHPLGSLGLLETMLEDAAALTGSAELDFSRRAVLVLCADNGVVAQGVTQTGPEATAAVARGLAAGRSPVCRMAQAARCQVVPVDMGILDFAPTEGVLSCRVGNGTGDITAGPAMSRAQAEQAVLTGAALAARQAGAGTTLLATGEMGIGNTTTSAAVACALLGRPAEDFTGRGAGLSDAGLARK